MRLLGAPATRHRGSILFWGSAPSAFGGRCRSLQQNATQASPFGHDPNADAGFRKDRAPAKPYCAFPNFFAHGSRRLATGRRANVRHQGMSEDIPYNKSFDLVPGRAEEVAPGVRAIVRQQSEPVHLQGHGELHRRPRQGRDHRSRPGRSTRTSRRCSTRCAARP